MKEIVSVRSNMMYFQQDDAKKENKFELVAAIELVLVHTMGKEYYFDKNDKLMTRTHFEETRMTIGPEMLITDLQLHQKKLNAAKQNADKINSLVQYLNDEGIASNKDLNEPPDKK